MPDVVLVHIGCASGPFITTTRPPSWLEYCVRQYFTFNDGNLYVLTDRENIPYLPDGIIPVALEDYHSDKVDRFNAVYDHAEKDFWTATAIRFVYLEAFLRENSLRHVYHFDNDVMVYYDLNEHHYTFNRLYPNIALTPENAKKGLAGLMYIDGYEALQEITNFFIYELEMFGEKGLWAKYKTDIISEMILIAGYKEKTGRVSYLPVLPFGEGSDNFDDFKSVFDPISWGEFVDGNIQGDPVPRRTPWSYIGRLLLDNPNFGVTWQLDDGLWCPYFSFGGKPIKINTLHIHSKNLEKFLSRGGTMSDYWTKLYHNYHELSLSEKERYNQIDRLCRTLTERFFFEGCLPIPGEMYKAERESLYDAIIRYRPRQCFEIGTGSGGGSTFFLASAFAKLGEGEMFTLEVNRGGAQQNYQKYLPSLLPYVEFLTGNNPALFLPFIEDSVDCVFLDGAEDGQQTLDQYEFFKPFFRPGSILMAHDWHSEKMRLLKPVLENDPNWMIEVKLGQPESVGFVVARRIT